MRSGEIVASKYNLNVCGTRDDIAVRIGRRDCRPREIIFEDADPQAFPLDSLVMLEGANYLERMTSTVVDLETYDRILCCKFNLPPRNRLRRKQSTASDNWPGGAEDEYGSGGEEGVKGDASRSGKVRGEWIVLDMMNDTGELLLKEPRKKKIQLLILRAAHAALLRVLHRSAALNLRSSFFPPSSRSSPRAAASTSHNISWKKSPRHVSPPRGLASSRVPPVSRMADASGQSRADGWHGRGGDRDEVGLVGW